MGTAGGLRTGPQKKQECHKKQYPAAHKENQISISVPSRDDPACDTFNKRPVKSDRPLSIKKQLSNASRQSNCCRTTKSKETPPPTHILLIEVEVLSQEQRSPPPCCDTVLVISYWLPGRGCECLLRLHIVIPGLSIAKQPSPGGLNLSLPPEPGTTIASWRTEREVQSVCKERVE
jgi:hypothetical protein